MINQAEIFDLL